MLVTRHVQSFLGSEVCGRCPLLAGSGTPLARLPRKLRRINKLTDQPHCTILGNRCIRPGCGLWRMSAIGMACRAVAGLMTGKEMPFVVRDFRAADLLRVLADACNVGSPWNMALAKEEIRVFPDFWVIDELSGEYLLRKAGGMREDAGRNHFLFFTHGVIIELANRRLGPETSIQRLDKRLEAYRLEIQKRFAAAAAVHFGRQNAAFEPVFVSDGIDFCTNFDS